MGMADSLGRTVKEALAAIAATGEIADCQDDWILFGEVTGLVAADPLCVQVRRTSMLMSSEVFEDEWAHFDLTCPVMHSRVDLSVGMWIGAFAKPCHRVAPGKIWADATLPLWNLPPGVPCMECKSLVLRRLRRLAKSHVSAPASELGLFLLLPHLR